MPNDVKKVGRPVVGLKKETRIGIRLDEQTLAMLNKYCEQTGKSKSDVIREAIHELLNG